MIPESLPENFRRPERCRILSLGWREVSPPAGSQRAYVYGLTALRVIVTEEKHAGEWWLHVSCSHHDGLPSWAELSTVKNLFIGREAKAIQVLPKESEYVSLHPYVLHLYSNLERDPLPDFRCKFNGMIGI